MNDKVSILLSIYRPREEFLKKQLLSLNNQTYKNLELLVWNDCPDCEVDEELFRSCITAFPYKIYNEHINLGYTKAFEKLVTLANGEYVCFCDQDDIWEKDKIEECIRALKDENATVAVCDKSLMDENDSIYVDSVRRNSSWASDRWSTGDDISHRAIFFCYATGMSIHARKSDVERFIPFEETAAHDRWLMAVLSAAGRAAYVDKPLVRYRRYGKNVTGVLNGVKSKRDYYVQRCDNTKFIAEFEKHFPNHPLLDGIKKCNEARLSGNPFKLLKYRKYIPDVFKYEFLLALCPGFLFGPLVRIVFK